MILLAKHEETTLAAKKMRQLGASRWATSTPKNRVWGFENTPSGRPSVEPLLNWETAVGSVQYTYRNASGRAEWLSRDPINEDGGMNLYGYCADDPVDFTDTSGLAALAPAPSPTPVIPDPVPIPPVPPDFPPIPVVVLVVVDASAIYYDVTQIAQIIEAERELQQMQAALAAQQAYAQAQRGKSNQADTGIMDEAAACGVAKKQADLCKWLQDQMKKARQNRDFERFNKLKSTYKDKCRGWRG